MIVSGQPVDSMGDVEVVDLLNEDSKCLKPTDILLGQGPVGAFMNGSAIACLDYDNGGCYRYKPNQGTL